MKPMILAIAILASATLTAQTLNLHNFTVETATGGTLDLSTLKGKKVMIVNVASKCGLTPQYEQLQELYNKYGGANFEIIAFPANNFRQQEPGTNEEIVEFCRANYGVTFPVMAKISVLGDDIAPIYKFLTLKSQNGVMDAEVSWNFQKFLIDEDGVLVDMISPKELPTSERVIKWLAK